MSAQDSLDLTQKYYQGGGHAYKPAGLYYSINHEWREWCESEMPEWVKPWNFYLYMHTDDILTISTTHQLEEFHHRYLKKMHRYAYEVDWHKVSQNYSGIEIQRYHHLKYMTDRDMNDFAKHTWLYGWDVSGGCIWDLDIIKKVRRYAANS